MLVAGLHRVRFNYGTLRPRSEQRDRICRYLHSYIISCIFDPMKKLIWMGGSREDLSAFPKEARREMGYQLEHVQEGADPDDWKPMATIGSGVRELRVRESSGVFRCIYLAMQPE